MTKAQLKSKVKELIKSDKDFILNKIEKAINSGCMDIDGAENNYQLPKNLLSAIYRDMSRQYMPLNSDKKQHKNIDNIYRNI
jgi:paraquat-inducible protein B